MSYGYPKSVCCVYCKIRHKLYLPLAMSKAVNAVLPDNEVEANELLMQAMLGGMLVEHLTGLNENMRAKLNIDGVAQPDIAWGQPILPGNEDQAHESLWVAVLTPPRAEPRPVVFCNTAHLIEWLRRRIIPDDLEALGVANGELLHHDLKLHDFLQNSSFELQDGSRIASFIRWSYRLKNYEKIRGFVKEILNGQLTAFRDTQNPSLQYLAIAQTARGRPATPVEGGIAGALQLGPVGGGVGAAETAFFSEGAAAAGPTVRDLRCRGNPRGTTPNLECGGAMPLHQPTARRMGSQVAGQGEREPLLSPGGRSPEPIGPERGYLSMFGTHMYGNFLIYTALALLVLLVLAIICEIRCLIQDNSNPTVDEHLYTLTPPTASANPNLQQCIDWIKYFMQPTRCAGSANATIACSPVTTAQQLYAQISAWFFQAGSRTWQAQQTFLNNMLENYLANTPLFARLRSGDLTVTLAEILAELQRQADVASAVLRGQGQ
jgi:hypothetical protein